MIESYFVAVWRLEIQDQGTIRLVSGGILVLACKQLPSHCILTRHLYSALREGEGSGVSSPSKDISPIRSESHLMTLLYLVGNSVSKHSRWRLGIQRTNFGGHQHLVPNNSQVNPFYRQGANTSPAHI